MQRARENIKKFTDIPNVGKATQGDLEVLGLTHPNQLIGLDPYKMHADLCRITKIKHDPCMIDVFISAVRYMEGGPSRKWWEFTAERKKTLSTRDTV